MTNTERAELFAALSELAQCYPHWRIGQLVAKVAGWADAEVWDAEDEQILTAARAHLDGLAEQNGEKQPGAVPIQLFELTTDNDEDQDELKRRLRKPGESLNGNPTASRDEAPGEACPDTPHGERR